MSEHNWFERLPYAIAELGKAKPTLERLHQMSLESIEVQWALTEALGIPSGEPDTIERVVQQCPNAPTIVQLLKEFPFQQFRPEEMGEVAMETDIIPMDVPRRLEEQQIRRNGKIWTIHRNDADPFPSNPHAHNYAENLKLDLSDGTLYRHKKPQGHIKRKDLLALRGLIKNIELPPLVGEIVP